MPYKPLKPCGISGCPELTTGRFCEKHQYKEQEQQAQRQRYYDKYQRDQRSKAFYNSQAWQALRRHVLVRDNHLCVLCLEQKMITPAEVVDHIVPIKQNWALRLDPSNCRSLCAACHNRVRKEQG